MSNRFDQLWERTGGFPGLVQSSLPPVALVAANGLWGLYPALATAVAVALAVALWRAYRGQSLRPAAGGLIGVAVSGLLAARSGEARDFFLADIAWYGVAALLLTISILIRRPLVGVVWSAIRGAGPSWRHDPASLRGYDLATAVLAVVFAIRFIVLQRLYERDEVLWLTVSKIAMNYPLWALALVVAVWAARRSDRRLAYCTAG
ncbi:DUF3159 domain-containing protein [Catenuloplanes atrovinosus]|uniref:DUF3159 domain-containing protein n=1 Tax=Catenuloplanes atrovinosus TaxID=137266 RepID=A0AAE4C8G3_9ACTN|nr:DUF3159 domain-containing protein [Catenuloplanes atrovinosus]MDR7274587.1 hypothetical protein [Catenuloplanes atrovinosus]